MRSEFDRNVTPEDASEVILNMRQIDVDELWAAGRQSPREAIWQSVATSHLIWCVRVGDKAVALCGVAPLGETNKHWGVPWLLGTPGISRAPISFFRQSKIALAEIQNHFHHLLNFVDARNVVSLRWLQWLGFTIHAAKPYGADQLPFHLVEKGV